MKRYIYAILLLPLFVCAIAQGDEGYPDPYVAASASGRIYARAIPAEVKDSAAYFRGEGRDAGETLVYFVGYARSADGKRDVEDRLLYRFNWYASKIYLASNDGVVVVRIGDHTRQADGLSKNLGIAFYRDGALLERYSMQALIGDGGSWRELRTAGKVEWSSAGYSVIKDVVGFVTIEKADKADEQQKLYRPPQYCFEIVLVDGRHIVFDLKTGRRIVLLEGESTKPAPYL